MRRTYPDDLIEKARRLFLVHIKYPDNSDFSLAAIARRLSIPYHTLYSWFLQMPLFSVEDRCLRAFNSRPPRLLTFDEELVVAGRIVLRSRHRKRTSVIDTINWVYDTWGVTMSESYLSKLLKRQHLSMRRPSNANVSEYDLQDAITRGAEFIERFRELHRSGKQIVAMDKTKFYNMSEFQKEIAPKGSGRFRRFSAPRGHAFQGFIGMVANGRLAPLLITTSKFCDEVVEREFELRHLSKSVSRRGEAGMLMWLEFMQKFGLWFPGDVLLVDSERALSTESVRKRLAESGVQELVFPKGLGHLMDPVELFISEIKRRYREKLAARSNPSPPLLEDQAEMIRSSYFEGTGPSIINYFHHCGLLGDENPETVMLRLLQDGARPRPKFRDLHDRQEQAYLKFKLERIIIDGED